MSNSLTRRLPMITDSRYPHGSARFVLLLAPLSRRGIPRSRAAFLFLLSFPLHITSYLQLSQGWTPSLCLYVEAVFLRLTRQTFYIPPSSSSAFISRRLFCPSEQPFCLHLATTLPRPSERRSVSLSEALHPPHQGSYSMIIYLLLYFAWASANFLLRPQR